MMNKKIIGIFVCMLLIATAIPAVGIMNIGQTKTTEPNDPQPAATKTGYLSIPAAAFVPRNNDYYWDNYGSFVSGDGEFTAAVYLPHEAKVTKLTFYWRDTSVPYDG